MMLKMGCASSLEQQLNKSTIGNTPTYEFKGCTKCKVLSCYDGDTITVAMRLEKKIFKIKVRMYGYDSPEMKPLLSKRNRLDEIKKAKDAKIFLEEKILNKIVDIKLLGFDKYGRILGVIHLNYLDINCLMIKNNHGYPYKGGRKYRPV